MNRTKIEWCVCPDGSPGFGLNPFGWACTKKCPYCYAHRDAKRLGDFICNQFPTEEQVARHGLDPTHTLCWNFFPHLHEERIDQLVRRRKPATIFLGSMSDLWDPHVPMAWRQRMWDVVAHTPQHTYIVLTKQPQFITAIEARELRYFSNLWLGVSVNRQEDEWRIAELYHLFREHTVISCEPLLEPLTIPGELWYSGRVFHTWPDWIIIGAQTGPQARKPHPAWVQSILDQADSRNTPVFMKKNLVWPWSPMPQELPYLEDRND